MNKEYLRTAIQAAIAAGLEIMKIYTKPQTSWEIEYKDDKSPLTLADRKAHQTIMDYLAKTPFPVLSEEGAHEDYAVRRDWKTMWVVDPLDGTKEFVKRNGEFTVNIALVENKTPILGVIYVPVNKVIYYGTLEKGAFKGAVDTDSLSVMHTLRMPLDHFEPTAYTVVASRSHMSEETQAYIENLRKEKGEIKMVQGGSSLKICYVAEGVAQQYPRLGPTMEWDTAAGHAIVKAAGGEMYNAETGEPVVYNKEDLHSPWFIVKGHDA